MANPYLTSATGNGVQTDFATGFTMDSDLTYNDVTVTLNGTKITNFSKISTTLIRFTAPIPSGALKIERFTPGGRKFVFTPGTRIIASQVGGEFDRQSADSLESAQFSWRNYYTAAGNAGAYVRIDAAGEHEILDTNVSGVSPTWGSPGAIGAAVQNTGAFTNLTASGTFSVAGATTLAATTFSGVVTYSGTQAQKDAIAESLTVYPYGFTPKNYWINGNFNVCQRFATQAAAASGRGMSTTATALTSSYYVMDRIYQYFTGAAPTWVTSRQAHPLGSVFGLDTPEWFLQHAITAAAGTSMGWGQRVEALRRTATKTMTLSFWAQTTSTSRTVPLTVDQRFGTGGAPSGAVNVTTQNFSFTTTATRFTKTFTVPSISGKTLGTTQNTDFLDINLTYPLAVETYKIWGIDLREGSTAPARTEDFGVDFETYRAQRYFRGLVVDMATTAPVSGVGMNLKQSFVLSPPMRAIPKSQASSNDSSALEFIIVGAAGLSSRVPSGPGVAFPGQVNPNGECPGISEEIIIASGINNLFLSNYIIGCDAELY
jgi:hypothetical protein